MEQPFIEKSIHAKQCILQTQDKESVRGKFLGLKLSLGVKECVILQNGCSIPSSFPYLTSTDIRIIE